MSVSSIRSALQVLPDGLREPLIDQFEQALDEYRASDWEKVGLKAGKFCEIAFCICAGHAIGTFPASATKPSDFKTSCLNLEQYNKTKGRSLCIQIPRILLGLYELRNNRAIGHVGGEVSPNHMDAEFFLRAMKWVMAEFVRFFSQLPLDDSHSLVEAVTARTFQVVWSSGDVRRILEPAKTAGQKVLILLYAETKPVKTALLQTWVEYKNGTDFKRKILKDLHKKALIHFDEEKGTAEILPPGQTLVEKSGLLLAAK
ncbi:hypothetical protein [Neorhizobium petrolearium]|uniref:Abortive infection protein-like C-terminal domain-containing protein n=1 Tax=Neorhizobium petrolearium TaxID=515361 RepID=A0ABY8M2W5_9HYPH|nr:hypothetical protein [Neorhizobium petrolearium]MCC2608448.1 hypothetical protein [Neorhizobium petrolearium]WGI68723.1 hypothetical protein QEO92_01075 [Neorhizobium petrolearium]